VGVAEAAAAPAPVALGAPLAATPARSPEPAAEGSRCTGAGSAQPTASSSSNAISDACTSQSAPR
jgi:hypothetical protein